MRPKNPLFHGLANAALADGPWTEEGLVARFAEATGSTSPFLGVAAQRLIAEFPDAPLNEEDVAWLLATIEWDPRWTDFVRVNRWHLSTGKQRAHDPPLPRLENHVDIAMLLDLPIAQLDWFADRRGQNRRERDPRLHHYHRTWITKQSGRLRLIESPKRRLKAAQRILLHEILDPIAPHPSALGFVRGRSIHDHLALHAGREVVVRFDLEDFFWQIGFRRVEGLFRSFGLSTSVASILAGIACTSTPQSVIANAPASLQERQRLRRLLFTHLPQGAPTSPAIANLCARRLDRRIAGLAARFDATYSRYADDLVISGDRKLRRDVRIFMGWLAAIVEDEGFVLNETKTRVMTANQRQYVGGCVINAHPAVPREERERLEAILVSCLRDGPDAANREDHPDFRAYLRGRIGWVAAAHPRHARALLARFDAVAWPDPPIAG